MIAGLTGEGVAVPDSLRPHEQRLIARVQDLLISDTADGWSLEQIAHEVGTSASTLQRLFKAAQGMSLFAWQRQRSYSRRLMLWLRAPCYRRGCRPGGVWRRGQLCDGVSSRSAPRHSRSGGFSDFARFGAKAPWCFLVRVCVWGGGASAGLKIVMGNLV